jgi:hypothetical protein
LIAKGCSSQGQIDVCCFADLGKGRALQWRIFNDERNFCMMLHRAVTVAVRGREAARCQLWMAGLLLLPLAGTAQGAPTDAVRAVSANAFLSSLGVNTHVDQGYDPQSYIDPLRFMGIREVRDGERHVDGEVAIARATGVHFVIIGGGDLKGLVASGEVLAKAGALLALEGPNEPNNFPINFDGRQGGGFGHSWYAVAAFQAALFKAEKADLILATFPIFGPSETGAETDNVGLQFREIPPGSDTFFPAGTSFSDFVNIHNYVSAVHGGYRDNQAWNAADPTLNGRWDGLYGNSGLTWYRHYEGYTMSALALVPRVTTETGWDTVSDPGGESVQGAVLTNTYLAQFKRGWRYTFIYELRDGEGGGGNQGLYHGNTPKQAAIDIHNLTTILEDSSFQSEPKTLRYLMADKPATVHDLLLQKSNGEFDLVVWDEKTTGDDEVALSFATIQPSIKLYDITKGTDPVQVLKGVAKLRLKLTDHAMIISITR